MADYSFQGVLLMEQFLQEPGQEIGSLDLKFVQKDAAFVMILYGISLDSILVMSNWRGVCWWLFQRKEGFMISVLGYWKELE